MFILVSGRTTQEHLVYFQVSYRKKNTSPGGFNFGKDFLYCVCLVTEREKRKLRNHVRSLVTTERLIKQSIKLLLTEKLMGGPLKLKDAMLL